MTRKRSKVEKTTEEIIYYITSLDFEAEQFGKAVRGHWVKDHFLMLGHLIFSKLGWTLIESGWDSVVKKTFK